MSQTENSFVFFGLWKCSFANCFLQSLQLLLPKDDTESVSCEREEDEKLGDVVESSETINIINAKPDYYTMSNNIQTEYHITDQTYLIKKTNRKQKK